MNKLTITACISLLTLYATLLSLAPADVNAQDTSDGTTAVMRAAQKKHPPVAEFIKQYHPDVTIPDFKGYTTLHWAASNPYTTQESLTLILANGADINAQSTYLKATPLHNAIKTGSIFTIERLLAEGADPLIADALGRDALMLTRQEDHYDKQRIIALIHHALAQKSIRSTKPAAPQRRVQFNIPEPKGY